MGTESIASRLVRRLCEAVAARLPYRVITGGSNVPYLTKYRLRDGGADGVSVHLHSFHRDDEDPELHSHPWLYGASLILVGGYRESRLIGTDHGDTADSCYMVRHFECRPGTLNFLTCDTFHRVELRDGECWTLFVTGPLVKSWGFLDPVADVFTPWRTFIRNKGLVPNKPVFQRPR